MPILTSQPTLWRTCRVLANDTRLRLFAQLVRKQSQSVSELAAQCSLALPVASQSLRALEARGLLRVNRIRRRVEYHIPTRAEAGSLADLTAALQTALRREPLPTRAITKLATAFTHPTRIQIHRMLQSGPRTETQIQAAIRLSSLALWRHLRKLMAREFVHLDNTQRTYQCCNHPDRIGRALGKLAAA
jgi:DNA-binding transcriptional ArsR family regulator